MNQDNIENESHSTRNSSIWNFFGSEIPRSEIVFFVQVVPVYIIVIVSIVNLMIGGESDKLWITLLSSSIGYILPSPTLNLVKNKQFRNNE